MRRAQVLLRPDPAYRANAFRHGVSVSGYAIVAHIRDPIPGDLLLIWNRYGQGDAEALRFEAAGAEVLVAENGYLGREWNGGAWYALARHQHNGAGQWNCGGPERWSTRNIALEPWREGGREIVVLATRGIGPAGVREPKDWSAVTAARLRAITARPVRIRQHPGERVPAVPLLEDLRDAWAVVTWGSGAALKALAAGVPVFHGFNEWIGRGAALPLGADLERPFRGDRLPMFQALVWAMWPLQEIESGECFSHLLSATWKEQGAAGLRGLRARL